MSESARQKTEVWTTAPTFCWLILFFLIPTLIVYAFSLRPSEIYGGVGEGWTLQNLKNLFSSSDAVIILRTFIISIISTLVCLTIALPAGFGLTRIQGRLQKIVLLLIILPFWSSFIIRVYAWKFLLHPEGFVKNTLAWLHIVSSDAVLLYQPWTVILVMVYNFLPFAILPIYAASEKFDDHLFEAAADLGMTRLKAFFKIFIPGIRTGILMATLLIIVPALGAYVIPDVIGGPQTEMIGNKIVLKTFTERNIPMASALSAFLSLVVFAPMIIGAFVQSRSGKAHSVKGGH